MEKLDLTQVLTDDEPDPNPIIEGMLYDSQVIIIIGLEGVGKSFLMYYVSMCLALGLPVLGHRVRGPSKVLYFDDENGPLDHGRYLRQLWRGLGKPDKDVINTNLHIEHMVLPKKGEKRFDYMAETIGHVKPAVVVVDTVLTCCGIKEENDNAEAAIVLSKLRRAQRAGGSTAMVLLQHEKFNHEPKYRRKGRGATYWGGAVDGTIFHSRKQGRPRTDGLKNSILEPNKVRAYGLREPIDITPRWTGEGEERGVALV